MTENGPEFRPIRVLIADDQELVRIGLRNIIENAPELTLVGEATTGKEAVSLYHQCEPDILLTEVILPEMDGITATKVIRAWDKFARIIALTNQTDEVLVRSILEAGAISYLIKNISREELCRAIYNAFNGSPTLAPVAAQVLIKALHQTEDKGFNLTASEIDVLKYVAQGFSNTQIALNLSVSTSTVKKHVSSILTKLNASNRAEAAAWAVRHKLVTS